MISIREIEEEIECYEKYYKGVVNELNVLKRRVPAGEKLRGVKHKNSYQYFVRTTGAEKNGTYIKKNNIEKARMLAQKEYDEKLARILQEKLAALKNLKDHWIDNPFNYT